MKTVLSSGRKTAAFVSVSVTVALLANGCGVAQEPTEQPPPGIPVSTSINAIMVALVDHAAHYIWEAGYADTLSGRDWQQVEQHAIQLAASGPLISLGGTGELDQGWAVTPGWQDFSQQLTDAAIAAHGAVESQDQQALVSAGDAIIAACESCHQEFKPDSPTEGILHIPHYD